MEGQDELELEIPKDFLSAMIGGGGVEKKNGRGRRESDWVKKRSRSGHEEVGRDILWQTNLSSGDSGGNFSFAEGVQPFRS